MNAASNSAAFCTIGADVTEVVWTDGTSVVLPHLWLRDNCACYQCRVEQTDEKIFHLFSVPADLIPTAATVGVDDQGEHLVLVWPDAHQTIFYRLAIDAAIQGRYEPELQYWDARFEPPRVDHEAFFTRVDTAVDAMEQFLSTGVLVVTDAPTTPGSLETYAQRLGPIREMFFSRIHDVQVDPAGYNVAHTPLPLPPHNDFAGMSWPPSVQALHMLANDCAGGESVIVDGFAILEAFRADEPELFDALCSTPVPFRMFDAQHETYAVVPMVELNPSGDITRFRYSNQVMQPMDPTTSGAVAFYRAYHALSQRVVDRSNQARFRLEGGHVLLVASHRILHARDEFVPNAARHLQDAYFEHDNLRNEFFVLRRQQQLHPG